MPNWSEVATNYLNKNPLDQARQQYLKLLHEYTGRNVISYYSAFLQKSTPHGLSIEDNDKNAFMQAVHKLDRTKGLDLVLHTPGGDFAATESIVSYLKQLFNNDIRVIIPQIAMSAGTMIALSSKEIIMGKQSNIGPIDPQYAGVSCSAIIEEFNTACAEVQQDPSRVAIWQPIISKYHPTFIGECKKAIEWSSTVVTSWLTENMCKDNPDLAQAIVQKLSSHEETKSHSRHIDIIEATSIGITITDMGTILQEPREDCSDFQDCILTLHHTYMHSFEKTNTIKIVENHLGSAMIFNQT